jgi:hypothetical protein
MTRFLFAELLIHYPREPAAGPCGNSNVSAGSSEPNVGGWDVKDASAFSNASTDSYAVAITEWKE